MTMRRVTPITYKVRTPFLICRDHAATLQGKDKGEMRELLKVEVLTI